MGALIIVSLLFWRPSFAAIYGDSIDFQDVESLAGESKAASSSVASFFNFRAVKDNSDGTSYVTSGDLALSQNICALEDFGSEQVGFMTGGSGVLIAPQVIVTAGHLLKQVAKCDEVRIIFDFKKNGRGQFPEILPNSNIYTCAKVLFAPKPGDPDIAVLQLNRPVTDRSYLSLRGQRQLQNGDRVIAIGSPYGLPLKASPGVVERVPGHGVVMSYDAGSGNSGGPILRENSNVIEGIHVTSPPSLKQNKGESCKHWVKRAAFPSWIDTHQPRMIYRRGGSRMESADVIRDIVDEALRQHALDMGHSPIDTEVVTPPEARGQSISQ